MQAEFTYRVFMFMKHFTLNTLKHVIKISALIYPARNVFLCEQLQERQDKHQR